MKRLTISAALATFAYAFADHYLHGALTYSLVQNFPVLRLILDVPVVNNSFAGLVAVALHCVDWGFWLFVLWPALGTWFLLHNILLCVLANATWLVFVIWLGSNAVAGTGNTSAQNSN